MKNKTVSSINGLLVIVCILFGVLIGYLIGNKRPPEFQTKVVANEISCQDQIDLALENKSQEVFEAELQKINEQSIRYQSATDEQIYGWCAQFPKLNQYAPYILETSKAYDIDPVYIFALVALESGHLEKGSGLSHNNVSGIKAGNEYKYYNTYEESILDTIRLTSSYASTLFEEPLNTVEKISSKWSESTTKADLTNQIMREIQQWNN